MEYCGNCDELHNEKDCTFYMFRTEKYDSDKLFVDCDLCETPDEMYKTNFIHKVNICTECSVIVNDDMLENDKIEGECPVCLEHTQLNNLCFDCCRHIYIGVTDEERPMHCVELDEPLWPYVNTHFVKELSLYDHDTLEEFSKCHTKSFSKRPQWMCEEAFIDYEYDVMQYRETNKRWNKWVETKQVGNGTCPLCRAVPNGTKKTPEYE